MILANKYKKKIKKIPFFFSLTKPKFGEEFEVKKSRNRIHFGNVLRQGC